MTAAVGTVRFQIDEIEKEVLNAIELRLFTQPGPIPASCRTSGGITIVAFIARRWLSDFGDSQARGSRYGVDPGLRSTIAHTLR